MTFFLVQIIDQGKLDCSLILLVRKDTELVRTSYYCYRYCADK